jgi:hypothetical protein
MRLTDDQRIRLCEIMADAFVEIRMLCREGNATQASDLADAFHNLPLALWDKNYDLKSICDGDWTFYRDKYPQLCRGDYVALVREVIAITSEV